MITSEVKKQIVKDFGTNEKDTGSTPVQIALLTARIKDLTEHLKANPKDHASRRGLLMLVGQRKSLLRYYKKCNLEGYRTLISRLEIRK